MSRWKRNYTERAEIYFKWEIDIMKKPKFIYDIDVFGTITATLPKLNFREPILNA